jgi:hypothetical protein
LHVPNFKKIGDIIPALKETRGIPEEYKIIFYEVYKNNSCFAITFLGSEAIIG